MLGVFGGIIDKGGSGGSDNSGGGGGDNRTECYWWIEIDNSNNDYYNLQWKV